MIGWAPTTVPAALVMRDRLVDDGMLESPLAAAVAPTGAQSVACPLRRKHNLGAWQSATKGWRREPKRDSKLNRRAGFRPSCF